MDMVEISCANCGKEILVKHEFVREKMYCTLGCMNQSRKNQK